MAILSSDDYENIENIGTRNESVSCNTSIYKDRSKSEKHENSSRDATNLKRFSW